MMMIRLYSCRHLHREVIGFWPVFFPQGKLVKGKILYLKRLSGSCFLQLDIIKKFKSFGFYTLWWQQIWQSISYKEELKKVFRDTMEGHFAHDLCNKSFSIQLESHEMVTLQQGIDW